MRKSRETSDETSFESVEKPIDKYFVKSVSTNSIMIWGWKNLSWLLSKNSIVKVPYFYTVHSVEKCYKNAITQNKISWNQLFNNFDKK